MRLGGPIFERLQDPAEIARAHRALGYRAAYAPPARLDDAAGLRAIEAAFRKEDVVIAEVGVWVNMLDPDAKKREENIRRVTQGLAIADEIGALCCVDIAGSFHPEVWYGLHPDNYSPQAFDLIVANARRIIDEVKPKRAKFTLEMMPWALPDGADEYLALIRAVDRPAFGVHLDPANLINSPRRYVTNARVIAECFEKLGRWIASCHAKDILWIPDMAVRFQEVQPGKGVLDYRTFLRGLSRLDHEAPLMLEHLRTAEEYKAAADHIRGVAKELGLSFDA